MFKGKQVSVLGAGRSGLAAARALQRLGASVLLSDRLPWDRLTAERRREITALGLPFRGGEPAERAVPTETDLVVTSPGIPRTSEPILLAVRRGVPIWSEVELAYRLACAPLVAVTGTNGKTTTAALLGSILQADGRAALVAGNISADDLKQTLTEAACATCGPQRGESPLLVAEISSFQLEWVDAFAPRIGILTNVTPDHLDRYRDFEDYAHTKARLFSAQGPGDLAIVNYDDPAAREIGLPLPAARTAWFTRNACSVGAGPAAWIENDVLTVRAALEERPLPILAATGLPPSLPGTHSVENALAAALAAVLLGVQSECVASAIRSFAGVPHRMEFVRELAGVRYINNSMCTNVAAAVRSIQALDRPAVVIAGGADKDLDFAPLAPVLRSRAKSVLLIGAAADKMECALRSGGCDTLEHATDLESAVQRAARLAGPGDIVILAPACASFDMFTDFEARGETFRRTVRALKGRSEGQKEGGKR